MRVVAAVAFLRGKHLLSLQSLVFHLFKRCLVDGVYSETLQNAIPFKHFRTYFGVVVAAVRGKMKTTLLLLMPYTQIFSGKICLC